MDTKATCQLIGAKIKAAILKKGGTIIGFSEENDISLSLLRRWTNGGSDFKISSIVKFEQLLGLELIIRFDNINNKTTTMAITKESFEFSTSILSWCMNAGITDYKKIQELFDLITSGMTGKEVEEVTGETKGAKYRSLRQARGLSLRLLGKEAKIPVSQIGRAERNEKVEPEIFDRLNKFFGI